MLRFANMLLFVFALFGLTYAQDLRESAKEKWQNALSTVPKLLEVGTIGNSSFEMDWYIKKLWNKTDQSDAKYQFHGNFYMNGVTFEKGGTGTGQKVSLYQGGASSLDFAEKDNREVAGVVL